MLYMQGENFPQMFWMAEMPTIVIWPHCAIPTYFFNLFNCFLYLLTCIMLICAYLFDSHWWAIEPLTLQIWLIFSFLFTLKFSTVQWWLKRKRHEIMDAYVFMITHKLIHTNVQEKNTHTHTSLGTQNGPRVLSGGRDRWPIRTLVLARWGVWCGGPEGHSDSLYAYDSGLRIPGSGSRDPRSGLRIPSSGYAYELRLWYTFSILTLCFVASLVSMSSHY